MRATWRGGTEVKITTLNGFPAIFIVRPGLNGATGATSLVLRSSNPEGSVLVNSARRKLGLEERENHANAVGFGFDLFHTGAALKIV